MTRHLVWPYAKALIVLPGTVLIYVPLLISWLGENTYWGMNLDESRPIAFCSGGVLVAAGLILAGWTNRLFLIMGDGTPAPWSPPRNFVMHGPYLYVRNPMIIAVFLILGGEALVFQSLGILLWLIIFISINLIYIPFSEEKALIQRFGDEYLDYCRNVSRWIPSLRPQVQDKR